MSLAIVHNFAISIDGFGTGEGQSHDAHFGHAGERLHEWMFGTRWWRPGGGGGVDDVFVRRHDPGIGAAPITRARGVRLWDGLEGLEKDYEVEATSAPSGVTHLTFTRAAA